MFIKLAHASKSTSRKKFKIHILVKISTNLNNLISIKLFSSQPKYPPFSHVHYNQLFINFQNNGFITLLLSKLVEACLLLLFVWLSICLCSTRVNILDYHELGICYGNFHRELPIETRTYSFIFVYRDTQKNSLKFMTCSLSVHFNRITLFQT